MWRCKGGFHPNQWPVRWNNSRMKRYDKSSARRVSQSADRRARGCLKPPAAAFVFRCYLERFSSSPIKEDSVLGGIVPQGEWSVAA